MRRLSRDHLGLSEIVGTLMLVLIVVGAATALSVFVQSYQKQVQAEQQVQHQQNLEDLRIIGVQPTLNASSPGTYSFLSFMVASEDAENSTLTEFLVNGNPVERYTATEVSPTPGPTIPLINGAQLNVSPREQTRINLTFDGGVPAVSSFYDAAFVLATTSFVHIEVQTYFLNDFQRTLVPPTAVALVGTIQTFSGSTYVTVPVLDGSQSIEAGANETIVAWKWVLTNNTGGGTTTTFSGQKWVLVGSSGIDPLDSYTATVTVESSDGLFDSASVNFL